MKTRVYISGINLVLSSDEIIELRKEYIGRNKHHRSFKIRGKIFTGLTEEEIAESDIIGIAKNETIDYFPEITKNILQENFSTSDINEMEKNLKKKIYEYNRENIRKIIRWSNNPTECYQTMIIESIPESESPIFLIIPSVFVKKMSISALVDEGVGEFELLLHQRFNLNENVVEVYKGSKKTSSSTSKNTTKSNVDTQNTEANNPVLDEEVKKESKNIGLIIDNKIGKEELKLSEKGQELLKNIETLRVKPYDDQTGNTISNYVKGATIGYGHLISTVEEFNQYKDGITEIEADELFKEDLAPFEKVVINAINKENFTQNEFDALVILSFNIGKNSFKNSSVVKIINGEKTNYKDLDSAWKAWNKSQGKVMKGLTNRRNAELKIYYEAIYEKW